MGDEGGATQKMKTLIMFACLLAAGFATTAQNIDAAKAMQMLIRQQAKTGLSNEDLSNSIVSNAYHNRISGTDLLYLQQSYKGLPVFNQVQTLAFKNDMLVSKAGARIAGFAKKAAIAGEKPSVSPETAVRTAITAKKMAAPVALLPMAQSTATNINFGKAGIASENIIARLMWLPINDGAAVKLVWQVYFVPAATPDYWLIHVDAQSNAIVNELNLTVYCNFDAPGQENNHAAHLQAKTNAAAEDMLQWQGTSPTIINNATYRVIPYPAESPNHAGGAPALVNNPWALAPGNATSLNWHSNGTTDYSSTRGNNVYAAEDRDGINGTQGQAANSTSTADPLSFDFAPDFSVTPTQTTPVQNQQFNITNLFYWNNIIHDLVYQYGFDEVSGNFQANNQGRGGVGGDYVIADAQDGGGTNNANFATPADGGSGRMQMYLWNGSPQKDGDADNGIIVHEFSHGISNRLAGGPSQAGCVSNGEHMGEGWSDYYSLMATQDWANAQLNDGFDKPRGIGTYATGQTPAGGGIRTQRYCTNFAINNRSYAAVISSAAHTRGEIWCATLWDMTWNIINQVGTINPNLFNANGNGGNSIALKLVTEGLKLQACNSGFLDGRDAILQADQVLYNGAYRCAIMAAFARRGMGFDAKQGSANSVADQVAGFSTTESILTLTQNVTAQLEGQLVTYTNHVSSGACTGLSNYLITDTLPANVTYVSGGTYNSATRVVSFNVNLAASQAQDYAFTVRINDNTYFPSANLINETVLTPTLPGGWTSSSISAVNFAVSGTQTHSAPYAFFGVDATTATDFSLATSNQVPLGAAPPMLSFWHNYNTEDGWDGGMVEISTNSGSSWTDLGANMTENGYNGSLGTGSNNPLGGRNAFTGNSNGFIKTTVSLLPYANQNALFRFRMASDDNTASVGWYIDDILLQSRAVVNIRSSLFNASATRTNLADTFTIILENAVCSNASINTQPVTSSICEGSGTTFSVAANGTALSYQWQVSTDGGASFSNIAGAMQASYSISNATLAMNGNQYRVTVSNLCPSTVTSAAAGISVTPAPVLTLQPADASVCLNGNATFTVAATGSNLTYQWQVSTDNGQTFANISDGALYSGTATATLSLIGATPALNNNRYRAIIGSGTCNPGTSQAALLSTSALQAVSIQVAQNGLTPATPSVITSSVMPAGNYSYQWSQNAGLLAGATASSIIVTVNNLGTYALTATDVNGCSITSNTVTVVDTASRQLFIYPNPNQGIFNLSYYSNADGPVQRTVVIYDAKGSRVYSSQWAVAPGYATLRIVLNNVQGGAYHLNLLDSGGKQIASGSVLIK